LLEDRLVPATLTVTTTADEAAIDGQVSLREAINSINAGADTSDVTHTGTYGTNDTIVFNIPQANPAAPQPQTILVGSTGLGPLPQLLKPVLIDGTTEPGFSSKPLVVVNGANAGAAANGFDVNLGPNGPFPTGVTLKSLVINGFSANGVLIEADGGPNTGSFDNTVQGCYIGTNATGATAVPNGGNGIFIDGIDGNNTGSFASNNLITDNVISGNANDGVLIQANSNGLAAGNVVTGNFIGTDVTGAAALPNGQVGTTAETGSTGVEVVGASGNTVGGTVAPALTTAAGAGNVISGNAEDGVHVIGTLTDPATVNQVEGNYVGVGASGVTALGNARTGIEVSGANKGAIGDNVVGANAAGIEVDNGGQNNVIQGNFAGVGADGVTPVGNKLQGVVLRSNDAAAPPLGPGQPNEPGVQNNLVGGTGPGQGNTVAFNGSAGIAVFGNPVSISGQPNVGNALEGNSVYQNGRSNPASLLGIDLSNGFPFPKDDGFTANDSKGHGAPNDPNNFQDFPILSSATQLAAGTQVQGGLNTPGQPNTRFRVEFFASNPDPLGGTPEGRFFLGFVNVTTDGSGHAGINVTLPATAGADQVITATATNLTGGAGNSGDTSEFSPGVPVTVPAPAGSAPSFVATLLRAGKSGRDVTLNVASSDTTALPRLAFITWGDGKSDLVALGGNGTARVPHRFTGPRSHLPASVLLLDATTSAGPLRVPVNAGGAGSPLLSARARRVRGSSRLVELTFALRGLSAVPHLAAVVWGDGTTSLVSLGAGSGGAFHVRHRFAGGPRRGRILLFVLDPKLVSGTVSVPLGHAAGERKA
jgi:parallel beta-helix repeat protein